MTPNEQLITTFYQAFRERDYRTMQGCYSDKATFSDEVFVGLDAEQTRAMWEMLCVRGRDLQLEFSGVQADDQHGRANWTAAYTFSKTNRKVVNRIEAHFTFDAGKIIGHTDKFDFYAWARQAFGVTGLLLGWTAFFKSRVQKEAMKSLSNYIQSRKAT